MAGYQEVGLGRAAIAGGPVEASCIARVTRRLVPFLILCYFVAYLDRVNVGFAALTMNQQLGFSPTLYAWGAGIFFLGYFIFEVPSNVILESVGARRWIARIMISWGVLSAGMAFIWDGPSFLVLRFLLGAAEAGFFPGIILYLTYWFPAQHRARIVGAFMVAIPVSSVIGSPISGLILNLDGVAGLAGWQWLFIIEGIPSVLLGSVVLAYLTDKPHVAVWLPTAERNWLTDRLEAERRHREQIRHYTLWQALRDPRVLALSLVYFGVVAANYGLSFWLPQIVKNFGLSNVATGFVTAIPYVFGAVAMVLWGRRSDAVRERKWHTAGAALVAALGLAASARLGSPALTMIAVSVAALGIFAVLPVFWTLPTAMLTGSAAAGGIALINSIGNLAGFAGPYAMGWIKEATGDFSWGLLALAAGPLLSAIIVLVIGHNPALEAHPEATDLAYAGDRSRRR
jgi:MFS transporter, ACS family, tartrate transporter